ncbi:hypothetical protein, partial [Cyanobium sp. Morenito 9A2]|uniref:beta strand repeat-containing protein n=1 Tax=Cyanobium sp. Morenito 9A2 TaxID=2823718 RepID=UPI0020CB6E24
LSGGLLTVDQSLLLDAQGGNVLLQAAGIQAPGAQVAITGAAVALQSSTVDVSGPSGGGTVRLGGGLRGLDPTITNAQRTSVDGASKVHADATARGSGGTVVVYGTDSLRVEGALSARGGPQGGDGGLVETSGRNGLEVSQAPDAFAPKGNAGTWLIDPNNVTIQATGSDSNVTTPPAVITTGDNAVLTTTTLETALNAGTNVSVVTSAGGTEAGDITVASPISKSAGGNATLTLTAHNNIHLKASISSSAGQLNLSLNPDSDASGGGATNLAAGATLSLNGGTAAFSGSTTLAGTISGSTISGSTLTSDRATLNNVTLGSSLLTTGELYLSGRISLVDAITLNSNDSSTWYAAPGTLLTSTGNAVISRNGGDLVAGFGGEGTLGIDTGITLQTYGVLTESSRATVNNFGRIVLDQSGKAFTVESTALNNIGTLELNAGTITIGSSTFSSTGLLLVNGGELNINSGNWSNSGDVVLSGGTVNLGGRFAASQVAGGFIRSGGTVNLTGILDLELFPLPLDIGSNGPFGTGGLGTLSGRINGGTVLNSDAAPQLRSNFGRLDRVTLGSNLSITGPLELSGTINLADGITLKSDPSAWYAAPGTQWTTSGHAVINRIGGDIFAGVGGDGIFGIGNGVVLEGYGGLSPYSVSTSTSTVTLNNGGHIISTTAGQTFTLSPTTLNNTGTIASTLGNLSLTPTNLTNLGTISLRGDLSLGSASIFSNTGSLAVDGATTVGAGASLSLNGGTFTTASLINQGLVSGSGPLVLSGIYTENGGSLGSDFSSFSITQTSGDLNLRGVGAMGPLTLSSLAGGLNLSGAVRSAGGPISLSASGATGLAAGSSLTSPGGLISVSSGGPLSLNGARVAASGGSVGGTVQLDGTSISLASTSLNTSGANDGGSIQVGLKVLPSNVTITNSSLIADPPALGGSITIDGRTIAITGSTLNVFGLSGGSIQLGSANTTSLSLDATTSLVGGGGASFSLFASSILNNASIFGGRLFLNGVAVGPTTVVVPTSELPLLVAFQQTINPIQLNLLEPTDDYADPGSPLVTQWETLGVDPLTITLTESSFLYADTSSNQEVAITPIWDWVRLDLFADLSQSSLYGITITIDRALDRLGSSFLQESLAYEALVRAVLVAGAPGSSPTSSDPATNLQQPNSATVRLSLELTFYPSSSFSGGWPEGAPFHWTTTDLAWSLPGLVDALSPRALYSVTFTKERASDRLESSIEQEALAYKIVLSEAGVPAPARAAARIDPPARGPGLDETGFYLRLEQQLYPSQAFAGRGPEGSPLNLSLSGSGLFDQAVQQLSPQQVQEQFSTSEQRAMEETASKLGLDPADGRTAPTPSQLQQSLRDVIQAVRHRIRGGNP